MQGFDRHRGALLVLLATTPIAAAAAQPSPDVLAALDPLGGIAPPPELLIRPRLVAAYGALVTAATLTTLYVYRGRAFIVYWIGSWLLCAGSFLLLARGYADVRLGSVMIGLAQLLAVWSAGLSLLSVGAFPTGPLRWDAPIRFAAVTAVWFLAAPFAVPLPALVATGAAAAAVLLGWAGVRYIRLVPRTRYVALVVIGAGLLLLCASNAALAAVAADLLWSPAVVQRLLGVNLIVNMFVALGVHVLVFEDMTEELRRANRELADANQEVQRLVITDPLTGCHNRRFFDEIERRELQRHRRYGSPLSVIFVDVDRFKQLNDVYGHDMGDQVLKAIGALLRRLVRESDYVIRWGGDEFLLLLTCGHAEAQGKAAELKVAFERERRETGLPAGIGLSTGVATVSSDAPALSDAIRLADSRMYSDKAGQPRI